MAMPEAKVRKILARASLHTGGAESGHFGQAVHAVQTYAEALDAPIDRAKELSAPNICSATPR